jgi:acetoin utilization deacetylase AcuC-like enzyme
MEKYSLLRKKLLDEQIIKPDELVIPHAATDEEILRVHQSGYLDSLMTGSLTRQEVLKIGFPWTPQLVERSRRSSGATIEACQEALQTGFSANLAGGTHHAFFDRGEGYCLFNDSVIAARSLQHTSSIKRILIVDTDVHQGNGTAALVRDDPTIFSFSIHGAHNYPLRKEVSDLDIALPDKATDDVFLSALSTGLEQAINQHRPEFLIYLAGADPYHEDQLGRLSITRAGLAERNQIVYNAAINHGLPIVVTMAGGYAHRILDTVNIHFDSIRMGIKMILHT